MIEFTKLEQEMLDQADEIFTERMQCFCVPSARETKARAELKRLRLIDEGSWNSLCEKLGRNPLVSL